MADRELRRLSRRELLEMLIAQGRENERLQAEITRLEDQLSEREIHLAESGNIAEAALRLNGVFEAAQRAAEQYLENVSRGEITKLLLGEPEGFRIAAAEETDVLPEAEDGSAPERKSGKKAPKKAKRAGKAKETKKAGAPKQPKKAPAAKRPKKAPAAKQDPQQKLKLFLRRLADQLRPLMSKLRRQK